MTLRGSTWRQVALDGEVESNDSILLSARDAEAHVAGGFMKHWVYDIAPDAKTAARVPFDETVSQILGISGDRMIVWTKDDALQLRQRAGGWKPVGKPFPTTRGGVAIGWLSDRAIVGFRKVTSTARSTIR